MTPHRHLFVAALFVAPLAIGSVHVWAIGAVCALLLSSAVLMVVGREHTRLEPGVFLAALGVLAFYTLVQVIPMPPGLVAFLSPSAQEVWAGALELAGRPGAWRTLSLEPTATAVELVKLLALIATFVLAALWHRTQGHRPLLSAIALVGVAAAVVAIAHRLLGAERVYGLYDPVETVGAWNSAPLLNPNHLAGLMALCAPVALGLGLESHDRPRRALWFLGATVMGMASLLSLSRGGIAALVLGGGVLAVLVFRKGGDGGGRRRWQERLWVGAGLVALLAGGAYVAFDAVYQEYLQGDASKTELWTQAWPMIVAFFPLGIGRGAYVSVFSAFGELGDSVTVRFAESFPVQWAAEWGVLGIAFAALAVGGLAALAWRGSHRPAVAGAVAGAIGLMVQNLVDFSIELLGVAVPLVAALAVVTDRAASRRRGRRSRIRSKVQLPSRLAAVAAAGLLLAGGGAVVWASGRTLEHDEERLREWVLAVAPTFELEEAREVIARHPADSMIPFLVGAWASRDRVVNPLPWLARASERRPSWGRPHLWIARALARSGRRSQALMEYRLAAEHDRALVRQVAGEVVGLWPRYESLRALVEVEPPPLVLWDALCTTLTARQLPDEAELANRALLVAAPDHVPAIERATRAATAARRLDEARELAARLPDESATAALLRADIERQAGQLERAVELVQAGLRRVPDDPTLIAALARYEEQRGRLDAARSALTLLERVTPRSRRGGVVVARAALEERAGRLVEALALYRQAEAQGGGEQALRGQARTAERQGDVPLALDAYRKLRQAGVTDPALAAQQRRLEQRAAERLLQDAAAGGQVP